MYICKMGKVFTKKWAEAKSAETVLFSRFSCQDNSQVRDLIAWHCFINNLVSTSSCHSKGGLVDQNLMRKIRQKFVIPT